MGWYVNKCKIFLIWEWNKYDTLVKEGGDNEMKGKSTYSLQPGSKPLLFGFSNHSVYNITYGVVFVQFHWLNQSRDIQDIQCIFFTVKQDV